MYFVNIHVYICSLECEKLIRRMLQLEPAKRIPLGKVLEHRWMQGMAPDLQPTNNMGVFGSSDNILWNTSVLAAIQKMNYDVERCKQVGVCTCILSSRQKSLLFCSYIVVCTIFLQELFLHKLDMHVAYAKTLNSCK